MRYLISVIASNESAPHPAEEIKAIDAFNEKIEAAGQRLFACGMEAPETASVFDYRTGQSSRIDGPHHSSNEYFSGFWIIKVDSHETAEQLAAEGSAACNRKVELRRLHG
jgi:hypothetical protein